MNAPKCPRCDADMKEGFVPDYFHGAARRVPVWVPGAPEKSFWMGLKIPAQTHAIRTFRCAACGRLESFAP